MNTTTDENKSMTLLKIRAYQIKVGDIILQEDKSGTTRSVVKSVNKVKDNGPKVVRVEYEREGEDKVLRLGTYRWESRLFIEREELETEPVISAIREPGVEIPAIFGPNTLGAGLPRPPRSVFERPVKVMERPQSVPPPVKPVEVPSVGVQGMTVGAPANDKPRVSLSEVQNLLCMAEMEFRAKINGIMKDSGWTDLEFYEALSSGLVKSIRKYHPKR